MPQRDVVYALRPVGDGTWELAENPGVIASDEMLDTGDLGPHIRGRVRYRTSKGELFIIGVLWESGLPNTAWVEAGTLARLRETS
jgi:hypothetical protein